MSVASIISFDENAAEAIREKLAQVSDMNRLANRIGPPLAYHWADHLKDFPRLPGPSHDMPSTGFGESVAESVQDLPIEDGLILRAHHQGIRQRYYGGTIRPRNKRFLCFGVKPESYGRSYSEVARALGVKPRVKGEKADDAQKAKRKLLREMFGFAKEVTQAPNPNVIPPDMKQFTANEIGKAVDAILKGGRN